ncbi:MAG: PAS domain S-box protein [Gallionella sp.]|nr:PAS domain S-box protein [Gallionella sp.]
MDNWQHLFDRRNRPAWVVLLVCFLLTLAAWYGLRAQVMKSAGQQFDLHVRDVIYSIEARLRRHEQILLGGAGLFDASDSVNRAEWRTYIERLNLKQNYPGIQGVGFSRIIQPAELQAHIGAIRAEGFPDYTVRPPGERPLYTSIIYLEPFSGRNLAAFGYDMLSEATRAKAMHMAAESGKTAISGKVKLVQETHGKEQAGFLMYVPVYRKHQPLAAPEQRWKALQGFVYSPCRVDDLMEGILGNRTLLLDFVIFDGDGETDEARMFVSAGEPAAGTRTAPPKMTTLRAIHAYGHMWTVRLHSRPEFEAGFQSPLNTVILALGGSISVLLFILVSFLISRRERAEELARQMTEEIRLNEDKLRLSEARLNEGQRIAKVGSWELDISTGELIWSDEIFKLFEMDKSQFQPTYEGFLNAIHPEDRDAVNRAYIESLGNHLPYEITHRLRMSDGRIKWVQERCTSNFDAGGKPIHSRGTIQDITERKIAEEELRQTKYLLDSIIENIPTMVFLKRASDLRFELFNNAGERLLGYSRSDLLGKNDYDFFPKEQADFFTAADRNVLASDKVLEIPEEPIKTASGEMRYFQTWKIALRDENGEPTHLLGISIDITGRKNAAESIARISNLHRAIVDGADHLIITTDTNGVIQSFNRSAESHFGYLAEELVGKATPAVFHDPDEVVRRAQELTAAGTPVEPGFEVFVARARQLFGGETHEWTYIRKDGSRFPVSLTVTALRDAHGEINAFLGIATDITERKRAEEELRKLSRAIEQSPVSVVITNAKGNIEYVNAKFSEVTGYTPEEVMGRNPRIVQSGLTPIEVYRSMWQTILAGSQWRGKLQNRKKSGELFWEEIHISAIRDSAGKTTNFVAVKEDITERIKVERMKNEFISTVSHELRTPLTSIRGALALIAGGVVGELPAAVKPLVDIAHKNSERLILLVNDILDIEKIEAGKMEFTAKPVKLMPLLHQALDGNRAYAEQYKVGYELEGEPPDVMVNVDANRLMQVFANLLSNAAKFSPAGSRVLVAAEHIDQRIRVMVKDNGPGIPDEFKGRIFQKFAQADSSDTRKKGGTGLGLSITKAIVEQMGGSIGFESQPNVQTVFYVEFPEWVERKLPEISHRNDGSAQRVLVCEDSRDAATILRTMLEQGGYGVDIAYDASQAKQLLAQGNYAAMTLDLALPGQSGISLIHELRGQEANANLPILVVSARAAEAMRESHGEQLGVVEWIDKPIDQDRLFFALNRVAGRLGHARPKVLHIEDDPDIFHVVSEVANEVVDMDQARNLAEARQMLGKCRYDLVILDLELPDGSGKELLPLLKGALPPIPVLVFSAYEIGREEAKEVSAALVKSRTDNEQLRATIKRLIGVE